MKVLQSFRFLITALVISVIALAVSLTTFAEEESPPDKITQLESQVKELMDFKKQVQNYNPNISPVDDFKDVEPEPLQKGGDGTNFPPSPSCIADHMDWPSSGTYKKSDWDFIGMPINGSLSSQWLDINGDGLVDFYDKSQETGCIYLNNGRGWDLAFKCYAKISNNVYTFYGDCAAQ